MLLSVTVAGCAAADPPAGIRVTTPPVDGATEAPLGLRVGDCFTGGIELDRGSPDTRVDCLEPHDHEVFGSIPVTDSERPDDAQLDALASDRCGELFRGFVGRDVTESSLVMSWSVPTEAQWEERRRTILCIVADPAGPMTGSLAHAAR